MRNPPSGKFSAMLEKDNNMRLWAKPETAINVFRPANSSVECFMSRIPEEMFSTCVVDDKTWVRSVAANPMADIDQIYRAIIEAC